MSCSESCVSDDDDDDDDDVDDNVTNNVEAYYLFIVQVRERESELTTKFKRKINNSNRDR